MGYRFSWVAGIAGIVFALARAERLLRSSIDGIPWEIILAVAAVLGATLTHAGLAYRLRGRTIAAINLGAATLAIFRIAVPATTWFIFPTLGSFEALGNELLYARDVISTGIAPVIPLSGVIAILAVAFWMLGALLAWGLGTHRPYVAVLAPLVVYLEFAIMDRRPSGVWTTSFMLFIGIALLAVSFDRRREGTGLLTSGVTRLALVRSLPSVAAVMLSSALLVAVFAASFLTDLVPYSGYLDWRSTTGLSGEYYGSIAYNPFVGIRQRLVSPTDVVVFVADIEGDVEPASIYWRMVTLDSFDGTQWYVGGEPEIALADDLDSFEDPDLEFFGPTEEVTQTILIQALQMRWLPAAYSPTGLTAPNRAVARTYRVKSDDASLRFDALTYRNMQYSVTSRIPKPDLDVLSRGADGTPSIVFAGAIEDAAFAAAEAPPIIEIRELEEPERFLELPIVLDGRIRALAAETTRGLETDYERAIALETYFRAPGSFVYSVDILPGHGATDMAAWLFDDDSPNYRTGYCEQFAATMAVMARTLGIPSRVVLGFTPGTPLEGGGVMVRDRNAHAWVELWMPTQGWVRFDPTPRGDGVNPATSADVPFDVAAYLDVPIPEIQPPDVPGGRGVIARDPEFEIPDRPVAPGGGTDEVTTIEIPGWVPLVGLAGFIVFGLVPVLKWARRRRRMRRLERGDITAAWSEILDRLADLGDPPRFDATPLEVADRTDPAMRPLAETYGEQVYGAGTAVRTDVARRSLEETEDRLLSRYPLTRRIWAHYALGSVLPVRTRRRRRRG